MRIVHVISAAKLPRDPDSAGTSGVVRVVLDIARVQVISGHHVTILVVGTESWRTLWHGIELASVKPFPMSVLAKKGRRTDLYRQLAVAWFCARHLSDVVHGHLHGYMRFIPACCRVVHFHSDPFFSGGAPGERLGLSAEDFATVARYSDAQIGVSQFVAQQVRRGMNGQGNVHGIPNGVDVDRFANDSAQLAGDVYRCEHGIPADGFVILFAGAMTAEKGILHLARSFRAMCDKQPDSYLLIAGSSHLWGPGTVPEYRIQYEAQVHRILEDVNDRVRWLGSIPSSLMPVVYSASDVVVVPSVWREGFGLVALEALASRRPVIASRVGGLVEIIDESCGRLVTPGTEDELLAALLELAQDAELRRRLGQAGRKVAERFSWESSVKQIEFVYRSVLGAKRFLRRAVERRT